MGLDDKLNNAATRHMGAAKESAGKLTGDFGVQCTGSVSYVLAVVE